MEFKIPPLPTTLGEVLQVLSRETPVPDDARLVEIIEKDPAISLYVLRQVNSAYYGLRRHVTEIHRAIAILGLKRVCNLVLTAALKQTFAYLEDAASQAIYTHIIKTSVATAAFARDLATYLRLPLAETAFTAGLLHQLGRLVFLYSMPEQYVPLWHNGTQAAPVAPSREVEQTHFRTDYLQLGASTLREWGLPEEFALITHRLHAPAEMSEGPLRTLALTVAAGTAAADALFAPPPSDPASPPRAVPCAGSATLGALAAAADADPEDLGGFLTEHREAVSEFTQSVLG